MRLRSITSMDMPRAPTFIIIQDCILSAPGTYDAMCIHSDI